MKECHDEKKGIQLTKAVGATPRKMGRNKFVNILIWQAKRWRF